MWSSYFLAGEPAWGVSCLSNESRSLLPNRKLTNLAVLKTVAVATTAMTVSHLLHVKRTLIISVTFTQRGIISVCKSQREKVLDTIDSPFLVV